MAQTYFGQSSYQQQNANESNLSVNTIGGPAGSIASSNQGHSYYGTGYYGTNSPGSNGLSQTTYNTGVGANPAIVQPDSNPNMNSTPEPPLPAMDPAALRIIAAAAAAKSGTKPSATPDQASAAESAQPIGLKITGDGQALSPDQIRVGTQVVLLMGVKAPMLASSCRTNQGTTWPCGEEATQYMQTLLDQGKVVCLTQNAAKVPLVTCQVGSDDLTTGMNRWPELSGF